MKVALVYDRINKWGGAERVLLALHQLFPQAPLFTSVHHAKQAAWADVFEVKTSFLQQFPVLRSKHEMIPFLMPVAFENFSFEGYDLVISITSESAKGIITGPRTKHICYCLTPTRYLWSGYDDYFPHPMTKAITEPVISYLRHWDSLAAKRPDQFVAISKEVQRRIKKYYGRESLVIYPPVILEKTEIKKTKKKNKKDEEFFLIVSRLSRFTKYKRIDLAIQACNELKLPLKIVGDGSWKKELEAMSGPTVEFLGNISDEQLMDYYSRCTTLIFPGVEDLGLTIIEAQLFGKPVIAFRGGGALETIKEGKTGIFFEQQTKESLVHTLKQFNQLHFDASAAKQQVESFTFKEFKKNFLSLVQKAI